MILTRPPVEEGVGAQHLGSGLQGGTALALRLGEGLQVGEALVGDAFIRQGLQALGQLQLRGLGRQREELDAARDDHLLTGVPARPVDGQQDPVPLPGARELGEVT